MANNPFYVQPAGDFSSGLQGLGVALNYAAEAKAAREEAEAKRMAETQAQTALYDAIQSNDPNKMLEVATKFPAISKQVADIYGLQQDFQKQEASDFATEVLTNPQRAGEIAQRRADLLAGQGRDNKHTMGFLQAYQQDPQGAIKSLEMSLAAVNPEAYEAYKSTQTKAVTDLGKLQQDLNAGLITQAQYDEAAAGLEQGGAEHGLNPIWGIDEEGNYTPFLPTKAGGITPLQNPSGIQFVPDSGRMGYNPVNIAEKGQAEAQTQLATAPVVGEAERVKTAAENRMQRASALSTKEDQTNLLNEVVADIKDQSSNWTTGFLGSTLKNVPGTPAADMAANLDTLLAAAGFEKLQEMRNNSPTGGALGSVTERELALLQATWGSIQQAQSREQFEQNLEKFQKQVNDSWQRVDDAYKRDYGQSYFGSQQAPAPTAAPRRRYNPSTGMIE